MHRNSIGCNTTSGKPQMNCGNTRNAFALETLQMASKNVEIELIGLFKWASNKPWTRYPPNRPTLPPTALPGEPTSKCKRIAVEINKWLARAYIMMHVCECVCVWMCCTTWENMYGKIYVINCPTGSSTSHALCVSSDLHTAASASASYSAAASVWASALASALASARLKNLLITQQWHTEFRLCADCVRSREGEKAAGHSAANETV